LSVVSRQLPRSWEFRLRGWGIFHFWPLLFDLSCFVSPVSTFHLPFELCLLHFEMLSGPLAPRSIEAADHQPLITARFKDPVLSTTSWDSPSFSMLFFSFYPVGTRFSRPIPEVKSRPVLRTSCITGPTRLLGPMFLETQISQVSRSKQKNG
jgi:hypothetical protein